MLTLNLSVVLFLNNSCNLCLGVNACTVWSFVRAEVQGLEIARCFGYMHACTCLLLLGRKPPSQTASSARSSTSLKRVCPVNDM
jgi:hypothetical protein